MLRLGREFGLCGTFFFFVQYTFSDNESIRLNQTSSSPSNSFFTIVASRITGSMHRGGIELLVNLLSN